MCRRCGKNYFNDCFKSIGKSCCGRELFWRVQMNKSAILIKVYTYNFRYHKFVRPSPYKDPWLVPTAREPRKRRAHRVHRAQPSSVWQWREDDTVQLTWHWALRDQLIRSAHPIMLTYPSTNHLPLIPHQFMHLLFVIWCHCLLGGTKLTTKLINFIWMQNIFISGQKSYKICFLLDVIQKM